MFQQNLQLGHVAAVEDVIDGLVVDRRRRIAMHDPQRDLHTAARKQDRMQWRGERYDGTSTRTGPLQSKKLKIELKDNAKK